jgi:hypothetical protein
LQNQVKNAGPLRSPTRPPQTRLAGRPLKRGWPHQARPRERPSRTPAPSPAPLNHEPHPNPNPGQDWAIPDKPIGYRGPPRPNRRPPPSSLALLGDLGFPAATEDQQEHSARPAHTLLSMKSERLSYILPVPTGHRTDWGEAFAEALEARLQELQPQHVDRERTGTSRDRDGSLVVRVANATSGEVIETRVWEDEAEVRWRSDVRQFRLASQPNPPSWIPDAVDFVGHLVGDDGFV